MFLKASSINRPDSLIDTVDGELVWTETDNRTMFHMSRVDRSICSSLVSGP